MERVIHEGELRRKLIRNGLIATGPNIGKFVSIVRASSISSRFLNPYPPRSRTQRCDPKYLGSFRHGCTGWLPVYTRVAHARISTQAIVKHAVKNLQVADVSRLTFRIG